jgi:hypothetical protein
MIQARATMTTKKGGLAAKINMRNKKKQMNVDMQFKTNICMKFK